MFVGTPLGTSDQCCAGCVLRVEQSIPEYNVKSTVFLKHCTSLEQTLSQPGAARSDPLNAFDRVTGEVIVACSYHCYA